ncbi:hypothetical protein ACFVAD_00595 [Sutcliffiella sp. NPDC057660]|uniref:hypothetical protein n=1 Tax=Sutcliffiella sp. NPDC057660 TaxID=3346199 RepID=UPI0036CAA254
MYFKHYKKFAIFLFILFLVFSQSVVYAVDVEIEDPTPDLTAPILKNINVSSESLSPTTPVKITADITDDLSGVSYAVIYYIKPSGKLSSYYFTYNSQNQLFETTVTINEVDEPGVWQVNAVYLYDKKENSRSYQKNNFDFSKMELDVSGVMESSDKEAPVLRSINVVSNAVGLNEDIKINAEVTDNESGVKSVSVTYQKPSGKSVYVYLSKNSTTGLFEGKITISQFEEIGEWKITRISLTDHVSNNSNIYNYLNESGKTINFDHCTVLVSGTTPDLQPPELDDLAIEVQQLSNNSAEIILTAKVSDELSGIHHFSGSYRKPSGRTASIYFTKSNDVFVANLLIDKYDELGKWELKQISLIDKMDNSKTVYDNNTERIFDVFDINVNKKITISPGIPYSIGIDTNTNTLALNSGESFQLVSHLNYTDKTKEDITGNPLTVYTSSNPQLVLANNKGFITVPENAKSGYAVVEVSYGNITKNITVKVNGGNDETYLKISPQTTSLSAGQSEQIKVLKVDGSRTIDVTDSNSGITYSISDPTLGSVSNNGLIKIAEGIKSGNLKILIDYQGISKEVSVKITEPTVKTLLISPTEENLSLVNNSVQIVVKGLMTDGTSRDVTLGIDGTIYSSSNTNIAQVTPDGLVTIPENAKSGTVKIAVNHKGIVVESVLNVTGNPDLVGLNLDSIPSELDINESKMITLTSEWSDGSIREVDLTEVQIKSSREDRVTISKDGLLEAHSSGSSNIFVLFEGKTFYTSVKVLPPPTVSRIFLEETISQTMKIGEECPIPNIYAEWSNGTISKIDYNDVTISSSRPDRIAILESGVLKAISSGSSTIDIKYGTKILSFSVKVEAGPTVSSIYLEGTIPSELKIGESFDIGNVYAVLTNGETTLLNTTDLVFSSTRPDRISVSVDGKLTSLSSGAAYIDINYQGKLFGVSVKGVAGPSLLSIALEDTPPATMKLGEELPLGRIIAKWSDSSQTIINSSDITYFSSRMDRIYITETGLLKANTIGTSNIDVFYKGKNIRISIKVITN